LGGCKECNSPIYYSPLQIELTSIRFDQIYGLLNKATVKQSSSHACHKYLYTLNWIRMGPNFFFLVNKENGHASRRSNDIPPRLALRWTPILYCQAQILLKKKGKNTRGGTRPKPSEKEAKKIKTGKTAKNNKKSHLRKSNPRKTTPIRKKLVVNLCRQRWEPDLPHHGMATIPRRNMRKSNHRFYQKNKDRLMRSIKILQGNSSVQIAKTSDIPIKHYH